MSLHTSSGLQELLVAHWPGVPFLAGFLSASWVDGPTVREVQERLPHNFPLRARRRFSLEAIALTHGPRTPPTNETPWDEVTLRHNFDPFLDEHEDLMRELDNTNLEDLTIRAENPDILAQAEIAARIHPCQSSYSYGLFCLWLTHGGWSMAGTLLGETTSV